MSYAAIRVALRNRIAAVAGIGQVATYERFTLKSLEDPDFTSRFVSNGLVNAWWVDRRGVESKQFASDDLLVQVRHNVRVTGVYAFNGGLPDGAVTLDGDSALAFQDLVDAVLDILNSGDHTLGGNCLTYSNPNPDNIRIAAFQQATMTVHAVEIPFQVEESSGGAQPMLYTQELALHVSGAELGDGAAHHGEWVNTQDFSEGAIWLDVITTDAANTLAFTVDYANVDKTIIGLNKVTVASMNSVSQQGPVALVTPLPAWIRLNWTITNAKNTTFRAVADVRGNAG